VNPRGRTPAIAVELDDLVFDLDCSAEAQLDNTHCMLEQFAQIFRDGRVDHEDTGRVLSVLRRTKVEHQLNGEQSAGMKAVRRLLNPILALVATLRAKNQELEAASPKGVAP
jgi:hypothetical protein